MIEERIDKLIKMYQGCIDENQKLESPAICVQITVIGSYCYYC